MSIAPLPTFHLKERLILNGEKNFGFRIANFELAVKLFGPEVLIRTTYQTDQFAIRNPKFSNA